MGNWKKNFPQKDIYLNTQKGILYNGDALEVLKDFPENSVDAVVTDPPYGIKLMGEAWDYDVPSTDLWKEVLRVLKPGGHLLSFFSARTYHQGVLNIEKAGFEIRDMVLWLYGNGMPKGQKIDLLIDKELGLLDKRQVVGKRLDFRNRRNKSDETRKMFGKKHSGFDYTKFGVIVEPASDEAKEWEGWNTLLKPAVEPIVLARKPISEKNLARNVLRWGTGGINVKNIEVPAPKGVPVIVHTYKKENIKVLYSFTSNGGRNVGIDITRGRYPSNVILDEVTKNIINLQSENASKFFYVAKAKRGERFVYCYDCDVVFPYREYSKHRNHKLVFHMTVKPFKLISYLVKMITPPKGIVLDPFLGSGTLGVVAESLGFKWIGVEINEVYCRIAKKKIYKLAHFNKLF